MKKVLCILACAVMLLLCACSAGDSGSSAFNVGAKDILGESKTLKVFAVGNSFSNDTTRYLYDIAKAEGMTEVVIGRIYIGGCSLKTHVETFRNNAADYVYYKNNSGEWVEQGKSTLLDALTDEDWDIITMQQASTYSGMIDSYNEDLDALVEYINANKTNPDAKLVWHMTWAYQADSEHTSFPKYDNNQMTMYTKIVECVQQKILPRDDFAAVIPVGTAVQNARTSYFGDTLTRDGFHLNEIGKVIGGYTWYAVFTGKPLETINFTQLTSAVKLSESNTDVIKEAVNNALKMPYEVTRSAYVD